MTGAPRPPRLWTAMLRFVPRRDRRHLVEELAALHRIRYARSGRTAATAWYRREVIALLFALVGEAGRSVVRDPGRATRVGSGNVRAEGVVRDVRHGLSALRRAPGFSAIAIVTLGLGIGAGASMFTVLNGVVLKDLPYPAAQRLLRVYGWWPERAEPRMTFSLPDIEGLSAAPSLSAIAGYTQSAFAVVYRPSDGPARRINLTYHSPDFFEVVRQNAALGRLPSPDAYRADPHVVVLSDGFWRRHLQADATVVGRVLDIEGEPLRVVAVMPAGFRFPHRAQDGWAPVALRGSFVSWRHIRMLHAVARLEDGATLDTAQTELSALAGRMEREFPQSNSGFRSAELESLHASIVGRTQATILGVTATAVTLLLVIASLNVANLALARSMDRIDELRLRAALGASRWQTVQQILIENALLVAAASTLGVVLARTLLPPLLAQSPDSLPRVDELAPDLSTIAFAIILSGASITMFAGLPALLMSRSRVFTRLDRAGGALGPPKKGERIMRSLLTVQVGASAVLLIAAGLLTRSALTLVSVDPGFAVENNLSLQIHGTGNGATTLEEKRLMARELIAELEGIPGISAAAALQSVPFQNIAERIPIAIPDAAEPPPGGGEMVILQTVSEKAFELLGIPIVAGRGFTPTDRSQTRAVGIVSENFAARHFAGSDPLGRTVVVADEPIEIVGIAGNVRHVSLDQPPEQVLYRPLGQGDPWAGNFVITSAIDPASTIPSIRERLASRYPDRPIARLETLAGAVSATAAERLFFTRILVGFALFAVLIATIGIQGTISYHASRRGPEMALRLALGATHQHLQRVSIVRGMTPAVFGITLGLAVATGLSRVLRSLMFGVSHLDATTYLAVAGGLAVLSFLAAVVPARRARDVDPMASLRGE